MSALVLVFVNPHGRRYHFEGCKAAYIGGYAPTWFTKARALQEGYSLCEWCRRDTPKEKP